MQDYTTIQIGDKTIGLRFQWLCQKWFNQASLKKIDVYWAVEGDKTFYTDFGIAKLIQCAYRNNNEVNEIVDELTYQDFYKWVQDKAETEEGRAELATIQEIHAKSTFSQKMIADYEKKSNLNGQKAIAKMK